MSMFYILTYYYTLKNKNDNCQFACFWYTIKLLSNTKEDLLMFFDQTLFNNVLKLIEEKLSFSEEGISNAHSWNLQLKLNVQEIFDKYPNENNEIKYILEVLDLTGCIKFVVNDHTTVDNLTPKGLKFLFFHLHNINFNLE